ncbi:Gfo/Idh/MocA family protein [Actinokineospora sp. UTMC 2448]|uniref:Gfo/Idh/MocA family protein n=1 Tax=Actinokineospora sp. UTMC 2448 TaxID=2268449 RepID=UPI002164342C|nr:Gfo/Idh/MocA family oxidoreductase [Actinokineospora sp. UTMC 2448]UVS78931.1 Putative 4,5-dihydroxyphthalate dehydrogenase [Actinokineospora sp. UTMC 2448]
MTVEIVLVGLHGYGRSHLRAVRALDGVRLGAVCDPRGSDVDGVPAYPALADVPAPSGDRVTIISTPLHTHADLASTALAQGSHVLLEKPPATSLAEFERLCAAVRASGLLCQVGFQSLGSAAVPAVRALVASGAIGTVRGIGVAGTWQRGRDYFTRSPWAGKRRLNGVDVVDGALTNPFAHAVATALAIDGSTRRGQVADVEVELFRANPIESDDTSALRLRTSRGTVIVVAVTLCAKTVRSPHITVHGSEGTITLFYKEDRVRLRTADDDVTTTYPTTGLLADLVARVREPGPLLSPLAETGAFMEVLEAVRLAPEPRPVPAAAVGDRMVIDGVDDAVLRCSAELALLSEVVRWT